MVRERIAEIAETARDIEAGVWIIGIPSPVQTCGPSDLHYYPHHVDLDDAERFDLDQPQRITREIAAELGLSYLDLRSSLIDAPSGCPYQPRNLHWTDDGHRLAADRLAGEILSRVRDGSELEFSRSRSEADR
jgi:lysophospholipase L1-like esterase